MPLNVLVVDDSVVMRAMIRKTLQLSGLELGTILEAGNGQEGLELLASSPVDVALVDLNMPVMTGEEMIERVRANPHTAHLPMLVVSTEGSFTRINWIRQQGAEFVHKPFTPETLREAVLEITGANDENQVRGAAIPNSGPDF